MKTFYFLFFFLMLFCAKAQTYQDVIYLKNGSKVKGMITEFVPNVSYTIKTTDSSIFVFAISDIAKIAREEVLIANNSKTKTSKVNTAYEFKKSYQGLIELGYGFKMGEYGLNVLNFNFINGYQFNSDLFAGIGIGVKSFIDNDFILLPLFADLKYTLRNGSIKPLVGLGIGYSFNPNGGFRGEGFLINPSFGIQTNFSEKMRMNFSLNFQAQQIAVPVVNPYNSWDISMKKKLSGSIGLTVGLMF